MGFQYFQAEEHAAIYNKSRPSPPVRLIEKIVEYVLQEHKKPLGDALDIGCGSGQSTEVLAPYFKRVTGVDPSEEQIYEAQKKNKLQNVYYRTGYAENIDFPDASAHLITASQACHWFHLPKFYCEVERVLAPGGVLAMYGYLLPRPLYAGKSEELTNLVNKYYNVFLEKYIPEESKKVYLENYRGDDFMNVPFAVKPILRDETISSEATATVADIVGFMNSGSAFQNYLKAEGEEKGHDLLCNFEREIMDIIGAVTTPSETSINIEYKYFLLIAKKPLAK